MDPFNPFALVTPFRVKRNGECFKSNSGDESGNVVRYDIIQDGSPFLSRRITINVQ
jgi:hypothetical protein